MSNKVFESSGNPYHLMEDPDIKYHMDNINELFQEVVYEFCLERYDAHDDNFDLHKGLYYDILLYYGSYKKPFTTSIFAQGVIRDDSLRVAIKLIEQTDNTTYYNIRDSDVVSDFISRITSIGYVVRPISFRDDYEILIYEVDFP